MARSDTELAAALAAGDQSALAELYDRYGGLAYSVALRVLGDPGRAEDVVQDAFLKVWRGASGFDATRGTLRSWLVAAVRNRAVDLLRGRSLHERRELALRPDGNEILDVRYVKREDLAGVPHARWMDRCMDVLFATNAPPHFIPPTWSPSQ